MKLENTIQNKRKFFCQYYGQRVLVTDQEYPKELSVVKTFFIDHVYDEDYLKLRSIEDLNESEKAEYHKLADKSSDSYNPKSQSINMNGYINAVDYLRSIGILIPWMGLSVKDLQDYGWAKTTKQNENRN